MSTPDKGVVKVDRPEEITAFKNEQQMKNILAYHYQKQINNYFGNEQLARKFLSSVVAAVQRTPTLMKCKPVTLINSFMMMAELGFMPSGVSGEAYVLPYKNKGQEEAQFQLGYQGIVTLLYGAGNKEVVTEVVRDKDKFSIVRGKISHEVDPRKSKADRGDWIGVYAIIVTPNGGTVEQYMTKEDIFLHAKKYSKSYGSNYSPWSEGNDLEGWMPRKTVLKQAAKLAPKNEKLMKAIDADNKDSIIADRLEPAMKESESMKLGNLITPDETKKDKDESKVADGNEGKKAENGSAK